MTFHVRFICFLFGDIWNTLSFHRTSISWFTMLLHVMER